MDEEKENGNLTSCKVTGIDGTGMEKNDFEYFGLYEKKITLQSNMMMILSMIQETGIMCVKDR